MVSFFILPKHAKTREPEDKHCVLQCTYIYIYIYIYIYMCDTLPLDNSKDSLTYSTAIYNKTKIEISFIIIIEI